MKDRYRHRKTIRHEHFEKRYNGPEDWEKVLNNPTKDVNKEEWTQIYQLFTSPKFIAHSVKKKENQKKQKYFTTQGTKSLAVIRHKKANPDLIESWKEYYWKKTTNDFVNDDARQDYMSPMPDSNNISGTSSSQPPAPTHPSMYEAAPSQHMVPPYMCGATPSPYLWLIPPSSQPPYPYMYGVGSSTSPPQYPWPMPPPHPPQQP
ncbi:uncharacterized protein LOC133814288 [Humulus lupulus]|uniref:uncharacterized protein LOC133814288 n=1 Tax=Humulus lupulus TaxID=3486 RepID=UPI002B41044F|nr:uncharacterized protein LOC133814288 [Humulus lupulus]